MKVKELDLCPDNSDIPFHLFFFKNRFCSFLHVRRTTLRKLHSLAKFNSLIIYLVFSFFNLFLILPFHLINFTSEKFGLNFPQCAFDDFFWYLHDILVEFFQLLLLVLNEKSQVGRFLFLLLFLVFFLLFLLLFLLLFFLFLLLLLFLLLFFLRYLWYDLFFFGDILHAFLKIFVHQLLFLDFLISLLGRDFHQIIEVLHRFHTFSDIGFHHLQLFFLPISHSLGDQEFEQMDVDVRMQSLPDLLILNQHLSCASSFRKCDDLVEEGFHECFWICSFFQNS